MLKLTRLLALLVACLALPSLAEAQSTSMTWKFRSFHKNIVNVELYSYNRKHVWPGGGEVYSLRDFASHNVNISCVPGERICFGAWVRGTESSSWGVGRNRKSGCKTCCYTCGNTKDTGVINLNAP